MLPPSHANSLVLIAGPPSEARLKNHFCNMPLGGHRPATHKPRSHLLGKVDLDGLGPSEMGLGMPAEMQGKRVEPSVGVNGRRHCEEAAGR